MIRLCTPLASNQISIRSAFQHYNCAAVYKEGCLVHPNKADLLCRKEQESEVGSTEEESISRGWTKEVNGSTYFRICIDCSWSLLQCVPLTAEYDRQTDGDNSTNNNGVLCFCFGPSTIKRLITTFSEWQRVYISSFPIDLGPIQITWHKVEKRN